MKKLLLLIFVVGFSLSFSACEEDSLNELQPSFDLPDVKVTDGEDEGNAGSNNIR